MTEPLRALIIEDEVLAQKRLKSLLQEHTQHIQVVDTARDGEEGLALIQQHEPEVIFLDIQMPVMNGLEMLTHLDKQPKIIFTTAYDEYALRTFEENAIDYLLKPIKKDRLEKAITKLMGLTTPKEKDTVSLDQLQALMERMNPKPVQQVLRVTIGDRIVIVKLEDVQYLMAEDKLTKVVDADNKSYFINPSLKQLEDKLPGNFMQVNRSCILNEDYVKEIRKGFNRKLVFQMQNGEKITLGSSYTAMLKEKWSL